MMKIKFASSFGGYGGIMNRTLEQQKPWYFLSLASADLRKQYLSLQSRRYFVDADPAIVNTLESIMTLGENMVAVIITPENIAIQDAIKKELEKMEIPSEKVFLIDDFILGEKTTLNYPTGVKSVQERLGHTDIQTTLNTYVHNTEQMELDTVDIFEKITIKA